MQSWTHGEKGPLAHLVYNGGPYEITQRKAPVVETQLEDTFKAALDKHINIALMAFIPHPSSITLTVTANAYTLPLYFDQLSAS